MFTDDWTVDPSVFSYQTQFRPNDYTKGLLANSWEFSDPNTLIVHLRQGIQWQNIPPVNGREFTADDIVFNYDRLFGLGDGFTKPAPYYATGSSFVYLKSVMATDKYTVAFNWTLPNPEIVYEALEAAPGSVNDIVAPEAVKQWGDLSDWHHAIGTGPFILQDFVSDSSATLVKNPNYWGYDERYPQNKLPYVDKLNILIMPDNATALAALRSGKIDAMDQISVSDAQSIEKTNPEILHLLLPSTSNTIDPRNDVVPFNDVRVRKALQLSIDLQSITSNYYQGTIPLLPSTLTSEYATGWGFPYDQWPQDLKDEYAYNPTMAKQLLGQAGYPNGFKTDIVADSSGDLDLLQIVKSYFSAIGVDMTIKTMDPASWLAFVTAKKQDAMAMRATGIIGSSSSPTRQLIQLTTGYGANWIYLADPVFDSYYNKAFTATSIDDVKQLVKNANEYVARGHFTVSLLATKSYAFYQPWFKGYNGQDQAISGILTPRLLCFYEARFWIDQKAKASLKR
jgi:peptide/nickel transport system substrate-binding protein